VRVADCTSAQNLSDIDGYSVQKMPIDGTANAFVGAMLRVNLAILDHVWTLNHVQPSAQVLKVAFVVFALGITCLGREDWKGSPATSTSRVHFRPAVVNEAANLVLKPPITSHQKLCAIIEFVCSRAPGSLWKVHSAGRTPPGSRVTTLSTLSDLRAFLVKVRRVQGGRSLANFSFW